MDDMRGLIDQMIDAEETSLSAEDVAARKKLMLRLFREYGARDPQRVSDYIEDTAEIPWPFLRHAVKLVVRHRVYSTLPTIGELWTAARAVAGMDREQYRAGRYLPAPTTWPPAGKRYAVTAGDYEPLPDALPVQIGAGSRAAALGGGE